MINLLLASNLFGLFLAVIIGGYLTGINLPPELSLGFAALAWAFCMIAQLYRATLVGSQ